MHFFSTARACTFKKITWPNLIDVIKNIPHILGVTPYVYLWEN
jgi:hypothetical protein